LEGVGTGLIGVVIGGLLAGFVQMLVELSKRRNDKRGVAAAIAGEIAQCFTSPKDAAYLSRLVD
jgi:hypothetical protein